MGVQNSVDTVFRPVMQRAAGVLLHVTSLPGESHVGTVGPNAYRWIDFLEAAGMRYWQMCPLGPTGYGDSPYQCFSSFALNPYFIDRSIFVKAGLLKELQVHATSQHSDYGAMYAQFWPELSAAFSAWDVHQRDIPGCGSWQQFCSEHEWLVPYGWFQALKETYGGKPWYEWPTEAKHFDPDRIEALMRPLEAVARKHRFAQYIIYGQWHQLKVYAQYKKIRLIGDVPIFTALDSADVWANPELFELDPDLRPTHVAGVPPDYFAPLGQLWGNPLYNWDVHSKNGYAWWIQRLSVMREWVDCVRLDHFRGFESYFAIPATAKDARIGEWRKGPGLEFFKAVHQRLGDTLPLIAEDLGIITPEVHALQQATGLPGMAVLQFAFGGSADNIHLPHAHQPNQVVYSGTHDNDTAWGWYRSSNASLQEHVRHYLRVSGQEIPWDLIRAAYASVANLAIVPLQDLLSLGSEGRMNTPGTASYNWTWRYTEAQLDGLWQRSAQYLKELAIRYNRA